METELKLKDLLSLLTNEELIRLITRARLVGEPELVAGLTAELERRRKP